MINNFTFILYNVVLKYFKCINGISAIKISAHDVGEV